MKQYLKLVNDIRQYGSKKGEARENMPHTTSYFGPQIEFDLKDGFPILTTKKVSFKAVKVELFWFLSGNTNVKFLVDRGVNVWNEDAYNYYVKIASKNTDASWNAIYMPTSENGRDPLDKSKVTGYSMFTFEEFCRILKGYSKEGLEQHFSAHGYTLGDCGMQYGKLWRNWEGVDRPEVLSLKTDHLTVDQLTAFRKQWNKAIESNKPMLINSELEPKYLNKGIDQLKDLLEGLHKSPMGRRHIISAWNPSTLDQMALPACHSLVQFNVREISFSGRFNQYNYKPYPIDGKVEYEKGLNHITKEQFEKYHHDKMDECNIPKYAIDCKMYQRSADVFLGVPFNIASYALFTMILAKLFNFEVGRFIHTFGDAHIYSNHEEQLDEQLTREPMQLPNIEFDDQFAWGNEGSIDKRIQNFLISLQSQQEIDKLIAGIKLNNYELR